jgi:uncharacterized protein YdhG (YjbR/CyaY superfamily)
VTDAKTPPIKDVDAYLAGVPPRMAPALRALRATIRAAAPHAEEVMRMGAPTYLHHGTLVSFSAAAKHCAFYVMSPGPIARRKEELQGYDTAPSAIRFQPETPLPEALVTAIVQDRIRENEAKR